MLVNNNKIEIFNTTTSTVIRFSLNGSDGSEHLVSVMMPPDISIWFDQLFITSNKVTSGRLIQGNGKVLVTRIEWPA